MRQKEVKTEKREKKTESEKPKRWLRHTPEGYQFTEAEYALNALGNFLTLIACGKIKLSWSDEVTRYLLIWSTFLGATCVYRHGGNIAITFIQDMVPKKLGSVMRIAVHAICCALFAVLLFYSCKYCGKLVKTATALPIKMKYIYLCIPISMGVLMLHALVMALSEVETMKEVKG